MRKRKIWQLQKCDREYAAGIAADLGVSPVVVSVLLNRGVREKEEIREFLFGSEQPFHEPLLMKDMQKAAERILEAVKNGEQITVYGDYDVDGISASSLLYLYLQGLGAKVNTYIPKRKNEGYGLNNEALAALAEAGTTLLVTVDCGISGVDEVAAPRQGWRSSLPIITRRRMFCRRLTRSLIRISATADIRLSIFPAWAWLLSCVRRCIRCSI